MMETTEFFRTRVRALRPAISDAWIAATLASPIAPEFQADGRIKYRGFIPEVGRFLRVIALPGGRVHNAFFDRRFANRR
jgi:hypothetical protein